MQILKYKYSKNTYHQKGLYSNTYFNKLIKITILSKIMSTRQTHYLIGAYVSICLLSVNRVIYKRCKFLTHTCCWTYFNRLWCGGCSDSWWRSINNLRNPRNSDITKISPTAPSFQWQACLSTSKPWLCRVNTEPFTKLLMKKCV